MLGYTIETTGSSFHLENKSGKRDTEELEWDSAGGCGGSWTNIWDRLVPQVQGRVVFMVSENLIELVSQGLAR